MHDDNGDMPPQYWNSDINQSREVECRVSTEICCNVPLAMVLNTTRLPESLPETNFKADTNAAKLWNHLRDNNETTIPISMKYKDELHINNPRGASVFYAGLKRNLSHVMYALLQKTQRNNHFRSTSSIDFNITPRTAFERVKHLMEDVKLGIFDDWSLYQANGYKGIWFTHFLFLYPFILDTLSYKRDYFDVDECFKGSAGNSLRCTVMELGLDGLGYPIFVSGDRICKSGKKSKCLHLESVGSVMNQNDYAGKGKAAERKELLEIGRQLQMKNDRAKHGEKHETVEYYQKMPALPCLPDAEKKKSALPKLSAGNLETSEKRNKKRKKRHS